MRTFVGLTGSNAAGKGAAAELLMGCGYVYFSLSDIVRETAAARNLEPTRDNCIITGNALRAEHGPGVLARMITARLSGLSVIDSIRNVAEVEELRKLDDFILLGIDADPRIRFERMVRRGRFGDAGDFEQFRAQEEREKSSDPAQQQLHVCLAAADVLIMNNGTIAEFNQQVYDACQVIIKE